MTAGSSREERRTRWQQGGRRGGADERVVVGGNSGGRGAWGRAECEGGRAWRGVNHQVGTKPALPHGGGPAGPRLYFIYHTDLEGYLFNLCVQFVRKEPQP